MRDTRTPREDEPRHRRGGNDQAREETWYEECSRPVDEPLIATIPLPDGQ